MRILWVKTDFLHPTTRGGQIRTLQMLRQLHRNHEIHYLAFDTGHSSEAARRSSEYCRMPYAIPFQPVSKRSPAFLAQLAAGVFSELPLAVSRYRSEQMHQTIARLQSEYSFDVKVCDFLAPAINIPDMSDWILFQHNVETVIWERHSERGSTPMHRAFFRSQARRMAKFEALVCQSAAHVVAVSSGDEQQFRSRFGARSTSSVDTGVDFEYFERPGGAHVTNDLVFVGSMDWMPNIDGVTWFLREVLPIIRYGKPDCRMTVVGRNPPPWLLSECRSASVEVTGTVPDVRTYLWNSSVSVVPLRVGGGTRLKIFEAMAARIPVVSTSVGAEGLPYRAGETILIGDSPREFATHCINLLADPVVRDRISDKAFETARQRFSWGEVTRAFEETLASTRGSAASIR